MGVIRGVLNERFCYSIGRLFTLMCLWLCLSSIGHAELHEWDYQGEIFTLETQTVQGFQMVSLKNPLTLSMIQDFGGDLSCSRSGRTAVLYLDGLGKQTFFAKSKGVVHQGDTLWVPLEQFLNYLGVTEVRSGTANRLVTVLKLQPEYSYEKSGLPIRLWGKARGSVKIEELNPQVKRITIDNALVVREEQSMNKPFGVTMKLVQQGGYNTPAIVEISAPLWWKLEVGYNSYSGIFDLKALPNFMGIHPDLRVGFPEILAESKAGKGSVFTLQSDTPYKYFWSYSVEEEAYLLEIPGVKKSDFGVLTDGLQELWPNIQADYIEAFYPVARLHFPLSNRSYIALRQSGDLQLKLTELSETPSMSNLYAGSDSFKDYVQYTGLIVLDPGHGGSDKGCVNHAYGLCEKDITLAVCFRLREYLQQSGWTVVLTRETDRDVTSASTPDKQELLARADVANNLRADYFVSLHADASYKKSIQGSSVHWWKPQDYSFAASLLPTLGEQVGFKTRGLIRNRFVVLRGAKMPAALVEMAFLSNNYEAMLLAKPEVQDAIARNLAAGINRHHARVQGTLVGKE